MGVLQGLTALRARDPGVNLVAMAMALRVAPGGLVLSSTHLWPEQNVTADALSRLREGAVLPADLPQGHFAKPVDVEWRVVGRYCGGASAPPARRSL